jgi:hypothetical protein
LRDTTLDLSQFHFKRSRSGLCFMGCWLVTPDGTKPCLVIIRDGEERHDATVPCIVTSDKAYIFSANTGVGDPAQAARTCRQFCEMLRLPTDIKSVIKLHLMIDDHIGDLFHLPPFPPKRDKTAAVAEVTLTNLDTGAVKEVEI